MFLHGRRGHWTPNNWDEETEEKDILFWETLTNLPKGRGQKKREKSGQADRLGWPPPSPKNVKIFDFDFRL